MIALPLSILLLVTDQAATQPDVGAPEQSAIAAQVRAARAAAEADAAKVKGKKPYLGPLGLVWGLPPADVKAALADRLELTSEGFADEGVTFALRYHGKFASLETDSVEADFFEGELFSVVVVLREPDVRPSHRRWAEVVKEMTKSYGPPASGGKVPESPARRLQRTGRKDARPPSALLQAAMSDEADDAWLAGEIRAGRWAPRAVWDFPNARVIVAVVHEGPDARGVRTPKVMWAFHDSQRFARWSKATEAAGQENRDF